MEIINTIELDGKMFFFDKKPTKTVLEALIKYDCRFEVAEVLDKNRANKIKHKLTIISANACNYRSVQ